MVRRCQCSSKAAISASELNDLDNSRDGRCQCDSEGISLRVWGLEQQFEWIAGRLPKEKNMKLLRTAAVVALTALGSITGGASVVHATPATGVLLGASTVKTLH